LRPQVCHVAAQYGQTAFIYHVALRWDGDVDEPDVDGRTPLHWAAYKGYADTIRLLLVMDARWSLPDREVGRLSIRDRKHYEQLAAPACILGLC